MDPQSRVYFLVPYWILTPSTAFSNEVGIKKWTLSKPETSLRSHEGETLVCETLNEGMCARLQVSSISTARVSYTPAVVHSQKALLLLDQGSGKIPDSWAFPWDVGFINLPKVKILRLIPRQTQLVSAAVITGEEGGGEGIFTTGAVPAPT